MIEPKQMTLAPGGTGTISVIIDLTKRSQAHAGMSRRAFALQINPVFADDFTNSTGWLVTAEVLSQITVEMMEVGFAEGCVSQGKPASRRVRVRTHAPLGALVAEVQPPTAGTASLNRIDSGELSLAISPSPTLPPGPFSFKVFLRPTGTNGQPLSAIPVEVNGWMHPVVRAFPRSVLFGEVETPGTAEAEVVLTLPPGDNWRVGQIECDSVETNVVAAGSAPDGGLRYRITQPVTKVGDHQTIVSFVVRGPDDRKEVVRVELRYHGRAR